MPISKAHISRLRLLHHKSARLEAKLFIAEGEKLVEDLLESGMQAHELFMLEAARNRFNTNALSTELSNRIFTVSPTEMERITALSSPSPILAVFAMKNQPDMGSIDFEGNLVLALDDIRDPGNLGTIIRTADWFGIRTIFCSPDTVELYNPKVVQATMGSLARVNMYYANLENVISEFAAKMPVYGTLLEGDSVYSNHYSTNGVLVIGNEARGISAALLPYISRKVFIPPAKLDRNQRPESLNASVATSIVLSEWFRQQNKL